MTLQYRAKQAYYYRSLRVDGKPVKQYVASGAMAELVADVDRRAKERKHERQEIENRLRVRLEQADKSILTLERRCDLLVHAALHAAGFHQHKREWRLTRDHKTKA